MRRRKIGILSKNLIHLLDSGKRTAPNRAASRQVAVHQVAGMLESECLVFLRQLPQMAFNAMPLDRILIAFMDEDVALVALAQRLKGRDVLLEGGRVAHKERCRLLKFSADFCHRAAERLPGEHGCRAQKNEYS